MASLTMFLAPATATTTTTGNTITTTNNNNNIITTRARRVHTFATAAKGSAGKSSEEKGFFDWLLGKLDKDGFVETDPILQKVEGKSGGTTGKKSTATAAPPKKDGDGGFGGFGGLFAKK